MDNALDYATLKAKQRAIRDGFPDVMGLRVHRIISWIGRAEDCGEDDDARFTFLWIAFNAAYADERKLDEAQKKERTKSGERSHFEDYFKHLVKLDRDGCIHNALWEKFSGPIRMLMDNQYTFSPFWKHHNGIKDYENWEGMFKFALTNFNKFFEDGKTARVLSCIFDRLYVLRNQIIHGGATWNSRENRDQIRDGAAILGFLMPVFVDIMMDNPQEDWGQPFYPSSKARFFRHQKLGNIHTKQNRIVGN